MSKDHDGENMLKVWFGVRQPTSQQLWFGKYPNSGRKAKTMVKIGYQRTVKTLQTILLLAEPNKALHPCVAGLLLDYMMILVARCKFQ